LLTPLAVFALEVTLLSGKEGFDKFSTLHLKEGQPFTCQEMLSDLDEISKVVCAFSKKPSHPFKDLQNDFFIVKQEIKNKIFFLIITPIHKIKLYSVVFDLHKEESLFNAKPSLSNHYMIVGYKEKMPFFKEEQKSETAINFPYFNSYEMMPSVGGLDIAGKPVYIDKIQDVSDYIMIKKHFNNGQYENCIDLTKEVMSKFPDSLFTNEFMFYQIKAFFELGGYEKVIEVSKGYLREYSADENIPEVLALVAKSYALTGSNVDADYFFDRLFGEHMDSEFANLGYIYKGETLEASGASSKALELYEKALSQTQNIDIAALAAYKLAFYKITYSNKKAAAEYINKILQAKSSFFIQDSEHSLNTMHMFIDEGDYQTAAAIAEAILKEMDKSNEMYEELLSQRALWLSKTPKKQEALGVLNEYLTLYPYGLYSTEMQIAKDGLFFYEEDANLTVKLDKYNYLIEEYANDTIGQKALYEKAKELLRHAKYDAVLEMRGNLSLLDIALYSDVENIVQKSAIGAMERALKQKQCHDVLTISSEHNVTLSDIWDDGIYECAMKGGDYQLAKQMSIKHLRAKNLDERKKWLYRDVDIAFTTGNYTDVIAVAEDLMILLENSNDNKYNNIYRIVFDTHRRVENKEQMIYSIARLEKYFKNAYEDLDRYVAVMAVGSERRDKNMVLLYGKHVYDIQKKSHTFAQTPFVEFTLFQAYMEKEQYQNALEVIKSLDDYKELSRENRSRQKYLLGTVYGKLWRDKEAQSAYRASIEADPNSAWAQLAKSTQEF
jgi:tetratricopeptide (TPR) repeat protein